MLRTRCVHPLFRFQGATVRLPFHEVATMPDRDPDGLRALRLRAVPVAVEPEARANRAVGAKNYANCREAVVQPITRDF